MYKIIADLHTHTTASTHAYSTISENTKAAKKKNLYCIGMTNHGVAMPDSPHIWHFHNLSTIPPQMYGVKILRGVEANIINYDGDLDIEQNVLNYMEIVIASFHAPVCQPTKNETQTTNAYLKLAQNPLVDIIGHSGTPAFTYNFKKVIPVFKEYGKLVEINNKSSVVRVGADKNCMEIVKLCNKYDVPIVVNSDAHFFTEVGEVSQALKMLSDLSFPTKLIVNADKDRLDEFLSSSLFRKQKYKEGSIK